MTRVVKQRAKVHPAAVRCDMVLHQAFRARHVRKTGIGGEVRHGVTSGVSRETSSNKHVTTHLHRECKGHLPFNRHKHRHPTWFASSHKGLAHHVSHVVHHSLGTNDSTTGVCKINARSKSTRYDSQAPFPKRSMFFIYLF